MTEAQYTEIARLQILSFREMLKACHPHIQILCVQGSPIFHVYHPQSFGRAHHFWFEVSGSSIDFDPCIIPTYHPELSGFELVEKLAKVLIDGYWCAANGVAGFAHPEIKKSDVVKRRIRTRE